MRHRAGEGPGEDQRHRERRPLPGRGGPRAALHAKLPSPKRAMGSAVRTPKSVGVRESSAESSGPSGPTIVTGPRITSVTARSAESAVSPLSSADARAGASASSALHGGSSDGAVGVMEKGLRGVA